MKKDPMTLDSKMLKFEIEINTSFSNFEVLKSTDRALNYNPEILQEAPRIKKKKLIIYLFKVDYLFKGDNTVSCEEIQKEYEKRNLVFCPMNALATFNKNNPEFADIKPNITQWKNINNQFCFALFNRWKNDKQRGVNVVQSAYYGYNNEYSYNYFAGISSDF